MDGPWEYYAKQNKSVRRKLRIMLFHSYVEYKTETNTENYGAYEREKGGADSKG